MNIAVKSSPLRTADEPSMLDHLFRPMGVDGVYARTAKYEDVVNGLQQLFTGHRPAAAEIFRFPPVMSRAQLERSGYLNSFPQLLGCVCALHGSEKDILSAANGAKSGEDWTAKTTSADLVLSPAACYPVYPIAADRGPVPGDGYIFDVAADVFRHEPSKNIDRLQSFRMREYVRIGTARQILEFRESWVAIATGIATQLGLPFKVETASDPFFGRLGQLMAANQIEDALKFELLVPVRSDVDLTACMSFNYHKDHFGQIWGLNDGDGDVVHTGCVAFGIDRLTLALFAVHGLETDMWPKGVRAALQLA